MTAPLPELMSGSEKNESAALADFLSCRTERNFSALFDVLYPRLFRHFRARGLPHQESEEMAQDVLLQVYRKAGTLREPKLFFSWLYQIAKNVYLQRVRSWKGTKPFDHYPLGEAHGVEDSRGGLHDCRDLRALLEPLGELEQQILLLRFVDELEYREIAEVLKIPMGTVKWRLFNAKLKLAKELGAKTGA
jgi:RNA polymerase sigma-70 factor, ECF subfamily